jgi:hypothetical protein
MKTCVKSSKDLRSSGDFLGLCSERTEFLTLLKSSCKDLEVYKKGDRNFVIFQRR